MYSLDALFLRTGICSESLVLQKAKMRVIVLIAVDFTRILDVRRTAIVLRKGDVAVDRSILTRPAIGAKRFVDLPGRQRKLIAEQSAVVTVVYVQPKNPE